LLNINVSIILGININVIRLLCSMTNCIFCKIADGEIPCHNVAETDDYLAFLDINPINKGHTLVIPKTHARWVYDVKDQGGLWNVASALARKMEKELGATYVMFVTWGLEVEHAHIHVVPRYTDDGHPGFLDFELKKKFSDEEMQEVVGKLLY
jgi:histidine triad (HIT) family protein